MSPASRLSCDLGLALDRCLVRDRLLSHVKQSSGRPSASISSQAAPAGGVLGAASLPVHELVQLVRAGLPMAALEDLRQELGLALEPLAAKLGLSRATLHRRRRAGRLASDESDRAVRFGRLLLQPPWSTRFSSSATPRMPGSG